MANQHNQTHRDWVQMASEARAAGSPDIKGTAIYLIGAPDAGPKFYQSVLVPELTYSDAVQRGERCLTVKWVPNSVQSYEEIAKVKASGGCDGRLCLDDSDCRNVACTCFDNECYL